MKRFSAMADSLDSLTPAASPVEGEPAASHDVASKGETPPGVADGEFHRLDPRSVTVARIVGWITAAIVSGVSLLAVLVVIVTTSLPVWAPVPLVAAWLVVVSLFVWLAHAWPAITWRHTRYRVDVLGVEIHHGVVWRTIVSVPRSRVQHTDVSQGPLERGHGLGTLVIYTAGTSHARVALGGLSYARALALRDHLVAGEGTDAV
jgi:membrane protein YdbS with pleckstrin-like domain